MTPVFIDLFSNSNEVFDSFLCSTSERDGVNILLAVYSNEDYSGSAFVLYEKDGRIYEVNGSHCSCYGLEGQWNPSLVSIKELKNRIENGNLGSGEYGSPVFSNQLTGILNELEK